MPLSPPVGRQHLHTRRVTCQGFFREDGLWDIEGRITDEKSYEHANEWRGPLKPGDFVHDMSIRLTLNDRFTIVDVDAVTDKSPYRICGDVTPDFKKLIGLRVGGGFHRELERAHRAKSDPAHQEDVPSKPRRKPYVIDTCHAWAANGPVVKRWAPDFYSGPDAEAVRAAAAGKEIEMEG